jgi:hypothetical protein
MVDLNNEQMHLNCDSKEPKRVSRRVLSKKT